MTDIFTCINTITTTTITFKSVIQSEYIKRLIFNQVELISKQLASHVKEKGLTSFDQGIINTSLKGKDIAKLPRFEMISRFAMPWNFIKHYLSSPSEQQNVVDGTDDDDSTIKARLFAISRYCAHQNATLDTLEHLVEWTPAFNPQLDDKNTNSCYRHVRKPYQPGYEFASNIASVGNIDILRYLVTRYPNINLAGAKDNAAKFGYLSIMKLLEPFKTPSSNHGEREYTSNYTLCRATGHFDIFKYLVENLTDKSYLKDTYGYLESAISSGNLDFIKYVYENVTKNPRYSGIDKAADKGSIEIIKFLHDNKVGESDQWEGAMSHAVMNGHLSMVEWLHHNRTETGTTDEMDYACRNGHISIVEWLHFNRTEGCTTKAMDYSKTLEIVQFLHINRTEGATTDAIDNASSRGNLDIIKYLHSNRTEGCTPKAWENAIKNNHIDVVKFLYEHKIGQWTEEVMNQAITYNCSIEMILFIDDKLKVGCTSPRSVETAAKNGRLDIIQYLQQHHNTTSSSSSSIWTSKIMDNAVEYGHIDIVKFLHDNRSEGCGGCALSSAAGKGNLEMVEFLYKNIVNQSNCKVDTYISNVPVMKYLLENNLIDINSAQYNCWDDDYEIQALIKKYEAAANEQPIKKIKKDPAYFDDQMLLRLFPRNSLRPCHKSFLRYHILSIVDAIALVTIGSVLLLSRRLDPQSILGSPCCWATSFIMSITCSDQLALGTLVELISKQLASHVKEKGLTSFDQGIINTSLKGKDIAKLPRFEMISRFAMPWNFIKHYLSSSSSQNVDGAHVDDDSTIKARLFAISRYCAHQNATLDTLEHLVEWTPAFNPQPQHQKDDHDDCYRHVRKPYRPGVRNCGGPSFKYEFASNIASVGNVDILRYLVTRYPNINLAGAKDNAAKFGYLSIMKLLEPFKTPSSPP
ncbi:hypothetical protein DFA_07086 [Cavenderia fasciculata]|uniref:Ankyrin repeat-containing protein n=1 Tax=Cavenderia fasciculata TaxID=261658 RepID=F4PVG0_CACFS|nr:uncharacterized protein DFA_07086 [Cavenderia fasciculata]EGG19974.1 hypothetical protein DFA_07086 [Cavenderia fasciculata]|eukprot:XP_004366957.1 hypothetical protein DFA_07086 [Cavenderia fasciculata]